jgi:hypothetical protein
VWGKAKKLFGPTVMTFVLDGKPFETTRLLVKPLLNDAPGKAFALVQGAWRMILIPSTPRPIHTRVSFR